MGSHSHNFNFHGSAKSSITTSAVTGGGNDKIVISGGTAYSNMNVIGLDLGSKTTSSQTSTNHHHSVDLPSITVSSNEPSNNSTGDGGFSNAVIDHTPANYSIIYIRKCS